MASLTTDKAGNRNIRFADASGKRRSLYLGTTPKKTCEQIKGFIEKLVSASVSPLVRKSYAPHTALTCARASGTSNKPATIRTSHNQAARALASLVRLVRSPQQTISFVLSR